MDIHQAYILAKKDFESSSPDFLTHCEVLAEPIGESVVAWVFGYQSKEFMRTRNISDVLVGGYSVLVDKRTSEIFRVGPYIDDALSNHELHGDPFKRFGLKVQLNDWLEGANKVMGVKSIRKYTDLGLRNSKEVMDVCLRSRKPQTIQAKTLKDAALLTEALREHLFDVVHIAE